MRIAPLVPAVKPPPLTVTVAFRDALPGLKLRYRPTGTAALVAAMLVPSLTVTAIPPGEFGAAMPTLPEMMIFTVLSMAELTGEKNEMVLPLTVGATDNRADASSRHPVVGAHEDVIPGDGRRD